MEVLAAAAVAIVALWTLGRLRRPRSEPRFAWQAEFRPAAPDTHERVDLRGQLPADGVHLIQGPPLDVVGESRYRAVIERVVGKRAEGHKAIVDAALVWEPENPHDPNAIAVVIRGTTCGYLPRNVARRYRPVMEHYRAIGQVPYVRGDIRGGFRDSDGSWADYGITLYVAKPDRLLATPSRDRH